MSVSGSISARVKVDQSVSCFVRDQTSACALLHIFLERIMTDALEDHEGTVSIGGRTITNLRFADDTVAYQ